MVCMYILFFRGANIPWIFMGSQVDVAVTMARKKPMLVVNSKTLKESILLWKLIKLVGDENTIKFQMILKTLNYIITF